MHHDNSFWRFSCALYAQSGVMESCLWLQDRDGLNVNLLLWCCWLGRQGRLLPADWELRVAPALQWDGRQVQPLRRLRRELKASAAGSEHLQRQRALIKEAELLAEQHEQALLFAALEGRLANTEPVSHANCVMENLTRYASGRGAEELALLADACRHLLPE